jgi:transposase
MATGKVIDVLDGRDAEPFTRGLKEHPGALVVCRDRAGAYALAVREGAPDAIECADRWHLWRNLAEHVERIVVRHRDCLKQATPVTTPTTAEATGPSPAPIDEPVGEPETGPEPQLAVRIRERYAAVHALKAEGHGLREIARRLELDRKTVRRFAHAAYADDLVAKTLARDTLLDAHMPYLTWRWKQGCRDVAILHAELQARGYRGSVRTLYRRLQPLRSLDPADQRPAADGPDPDPAPPKIRHVTTWLLRRPENLTPDAQSKLAAIQARCPCLDRAAAHVTAFAKMMTNLRGTRDLDDWLVAVETDDIPELHTFARGIRQDYAAVRNGLSLPHNSGACEGNVNRLKALKRQMFGRAGLDLLRKRAVLLAS